MLLIFLFMFFCGNVNGIVYRGTYMSMYVNTSSGYTVYPDDRDFNVTGYLLFLDDQRLPVTNYSGTIEIIYFNYSCYTVYQTIEYVSCPRIHNNAFRSCLIKVSKHHQSQLRINSSIETGVLLEIKNPKPSDSGVYIFRVQLENNKTDVFGISAFVYSFNKSGENITKPDSNQTENFTNHLVTPSTTISTKPFSETSHLNTFPTDIPAPVCHEVGKIENLYELLLGLNGNITDDVLLSEDSLIIQKTNIVTNTKINGQDYKKFKYLERNRKIAFVVIPLSIILLILLAIFGSIVNNVIRRHFFSCRRIYRPRTNPKIIIEKTQMLQGEKIENVCNEMSTWKNSTQKKPNSKALQREPSLETIKETIKEEM